MADRPKSMSEMLSPIAMSVASSRSSNGLAFARQTLTRTNPIRPTSPDPLVVDPAFSVTIAGLTNRTCRWPLWGHDDRPGDEGRYCGLPPASGEPYCTPHCRLAYKDFPR